MKPLIKMIANLIRNLRYLAKMERTFEKAAKEIERHQGGRRYPPASLD